MPLSDIQHRAFVKWLSDRTRRRDRLDFIWDNLDGSQKTGLVNRVKSDLATDYSDLLLTVSGTYDDITGDL
jgi:hypothetical protein